MILAPTCRRGAEAWASAVCPEPRGAAARTSGAGERSPLHTSVAGAQQHDPVARLPGARTDSVRHSGAVRRHTFSRRPSSSVGPRATPPTPSHSAPRAALSTRCRPVGAPPRAARHGTSTRNDTGWRAACTRQQGRGTAGIEDHIATAAPQVHGYRLTVARRALTVRIAT